MAASWLTSWRASLRVARQKISDLSQPCGAMPQKFFVLRQDCVVMREEFSVTDQESAVVRQGCHVTRRRCSGSRRNVFVTEQDWRVMKKSCGVTRQPRRLGSCWPDRRGSGRQLDEPESRGAESSRLHNPRSIHPPSALQRCIESEEQALAEVFGLPLTPPGQRFEAPVPLADVDSAHTT